MRVLAKRERTDDEKAQHQARQVQRLVGEKIRSIRHERLLTIEQLAELADIHPNYLGSVERGERNLSLINICRIASGLGVPAAALLTEVPTPH